MEKFEFLRIFLSRKIMCCDRCDDDDICAVSPCSNRGTFVKYEIPSLENSTPPLNILSFRFPFPFPRTEKKKERRKKKISRTQKPETQFQESSLFYAFPCLPREAPSFHACVSRGHEEVKPLFPRQTNK